MTAKAGTASPNALSCSFVVILSRIGNDLEGEGYVSCAYTVSAIYIYMEIDRSRFYGWQRMDDINGTVYNTDHFNLPILYNCSGTGTHDFRAYGESDITYKGVEYTSTDSDQISKVSC